MQDSEGGNEEKELKDLCNDLKKPIRMIMREDIKLRSRDPLHFFQSLAFVLRSESLPCVAVSSFMDTNGFTKLYVASNQTIPESEQSEITDLINLFLETKPVTEIVEKVIPRQFSYIMRQFHSISFNHIEDFSHIRKEWATELSSLMKTLFFKESWTLEDIDPLLRLVWKNIKNLKAEKMKTTKKGMAFRLCKIFEIHEAIIFVAKKVKLHQEDASLKMLSKPFEFLENKNQCHAELAILKTATELCASKTLYIGVSKRPCYCYSLLFNAISERKCMKFTISIVKTNGKLYGNWNKIEGFLIDEFRLVWTKVIEQRALIEKPVDDSSSFGYSLKTNIGYIDDL